MTNLIPDAVYAVSGLTTGISTAQKMTAYMPMPDLIEQRELLVQMQDTAAEALQRIDRHIETLGEAARLDAAQHCARAVA